jgi:hypothetical protein
VVCSSQADPLLRPSLEHGKLMTQRKNLYLHTCSCLEPRPQHKNKRGCDRFSWPREINNRRC